MDLLAVASGGETSTSQTVLIVSGALLAITAAVITNLIAAKRGHVKAQLDAEISDLEDRASRGRSALTQSLDTHRSARLLWAMVELRPVPPDAFYESYFHTVVTWFGQAGADAVGGLGVAATSDEDIGSVPELRTLVRLSKDASTLGPSHLEALVKEGEALRARLVPHTNALVDQLQEKVRQRAEHERTTLRLLSVGTSVQILSLVAIATKDLL